MGNKTFILGVGAQKSGTTWLHTQLNKNTNIDMGFMKEYHVFDTVYLDECSRWRNEIIESVIDNANKGILGKGHPHHQNLVKRLSFIDDLNNYFDYFDYLCLKNNQIEAVGDITPSYALLNEQALINIKKGLEARGFTVKVVFLMRDPVERVWSQVRMEKNNRLKKGISNSLSQIEELHKIYKLPHIEKRTQYNKTILSLERVFNSRDIFYGFYEELFTSEIYDELQSFLKVNLIEPDFAFKSNPTPKNENIPDALAEEISNYYREVYVYISKKFSNRMDKVWFGYQWLK